MAEMTAQEVFALLNPAGRNRVVLLPTQAWELYNYVEQQQQQIEKLKCCGNCKKFEGFYAESYQCEKAVTKTAPWLKCDKWEAADNG